MTTDTGRDLQRDHAGRLRHLLTLEGLSADELRGLLDFAQFYVRHPGDMAARDGSLAGRTVANLFFEPSTRTRVSFELAAKRLGADVVNLDLHSSSRVKGETVLDTIYTLQAMGVDVFVMRDSEPGVSAFVAAHVQPHVSVLNAGEAHVSHPTQGLLDVLTIRQRKGQDLRPLSVAVVGDIKHSRVARSSVTALLTLGVGDLRLVSPVALAPDDEELVGARRYSSLEDGLRGVDVIMALRIQKERMDTSQIPDVDAFVREWGITEQTIRLAKPDAIVLHPGPMNRGVEITSPVADGPQSAVQLQVRNGVAVRMAVLSTIVRNVQIRNVEAGRRDA
ncbi:MAG TPA: aspartate carbamoyltransferase catalytic subunit [Steroidobacteraceae bacterium]|nr:aspartate carbamoyltransferase catalytic subunit [Steroidobacteraceae bacterium]